MTRKQKWEIKSSDWGLGLVAVVLGVISLYLYFTSKQNRRNVRTLRGDTEGRSSSTENKCLYTGWKVLIGFSAISEEYEIRPSELDILYHIAGLCDLYILCQVESDVGQELAKDACEASGLCKAGLNTCKLLFCSTRKGKEAIGRQLSPALFIDDDESTIAYLSAHLPHLAFIDKSLPSSSTSSSSSANTTQVSGGGVHPHPTVRGVVVSPSVADYFKALAPS